MLSGARPAHSARPDSQQNPIRMQKSTDPASPVRPATTAYAKQMNTLFDDAKEKP
jgi:hypothetical protein